MYLDISVPRIVLTRLLGRFSKRAYYSGTSPLRLVTIPDPPLPAPDWVRVRNRMCGICGSDLHQLFVDAGLDVSPVALPSHKRIYLGHEMIGEVVEVGAQAGGFCVGDRVVRWGRADDCLARGRTELCPACRRGHRVLCEFAAEAREHTPIGGGFGDSFITPASTLLPVPDVLSDEQAIFVEPLAVAIHAAFRRRVNAGDKVLILGSGTIGYLLMQVIRLIQPDCELSAVAQFPWQAEIARQFGARNVFLAADDGYRAVCDITGARLYQGRGENRMLLGGFDLLFDVVGTPSTLQDVLRWSRAGGAVVLVGVYLHRMTVDLTPVWHQEVDLLGAVGHDIVTWAGETISAFDLAMRWLQSGSIETDLLLTHRFTLAAYQQAFQAATDKAGSRSIKVAFEM